ncbi:NUDIX hydrolase [Cupriavidus sp. CuC1]|uniref:NUDIX hydrolase n=1 Tax=Cupriavidus sp. CuC1 TaxID=3373131 RepID=UPI0037D13A1D
MPTNFHPKSDDKGKPVALRKPSQPTPLSSWQQPGTFSIVVPCGELPAELNGIPLRSWLDAPQSIAAWNAVAGQAEIGEPAFSPPNGKAEAAGLIIEESDGRIWQVAPSNGYGGYTATFPKGRVEHGINRQASAIKEAWEETGLKAEITGFVADSVRSLTYTRYYRARRVGGNPADMGWESQAVMLVPKSQLGQFLTNANDLPLLEALIA